MLAVEAKTSDGSEFFGSGSRIVEVRDDLVLSSLAKGTSSVVGGVEEAAVHAPSIATGALSSSALYVDITFFLCPKSDQECSCSYSYELAVDSDAS